MILSDNVATLIHDLKNPILAQEQVLNLLLQNTFGELSDAQKEIIVQIKESCQYLKNLVFSAMNEYRSNSSNINLKPQNFNFKTLLISIINEFKALAEQNFQILKIDCDDVFVFADEFQIKRVISNLLGNAITYGDKNSDIEIIFKKMDGNVFFIIKNLSKPIENLDKVFDKFESSTNSGLGLYFVKQVINAHNGSVFARQEDENKYSFGFVIPNI
ncbi:HAMP domain-containing histidine kinase [bacterium]|nr:HAMP domain-containing histidine kinase [bacterium]